MAMVRGLTKKGIAKVKQVRFVDTTIRDGQQSLWASNMKTEHMLAIMPYLDAAGFESMEFIATGSRLKKFVRHLKENPWDWIKGGAAAAKRTPLRWHGTISGRTLSGYVPRSVGELLAKKAVDLGIRYIRTGNNWNDYSVMKSQMERLDGLGMIPVVNVIYSVSPRHTDEYYVERTKEAAALSPFRLCFKDVGGLLTPERVRQLVPKLIDASPGMAWEFHGHCNNSLGPVNALEFAKLGITVIHTAVPPLANANSQPSIFNVAANLRALAFDPLVNEEALAPVTQYLTHVAKREDLQIGVPYEYDEMPYHHQVPGGMVSNLRYQLSLAGVEDHLDAVLTEIEHVRADLGYPIMVTPLSQIVGTQAAINVIVGERYTQVTDATIEYALGRHGREAPSVMDQGVRDRILDRSRAREIEIQEDWEPTLGELRQKYGVSMSDEDLILCAIVGDDALDVVGSSSKTNYRVASPKPLAELIHELLANGSNKQLHVKDGQFSFSVVRGA